MELVVLLCQDSEHLFFVSQHRDLYIESPTDLG